MIIALDGPAGSGKSTIAKKLAKQLGINYLDTGAMYRAITYYMLENNIDITNNRLVIDNLENIDLDIKDEELYLNGTNISKNIRSEEVNQNISGIASIKEVREKLVNMQRIIGSKQDTILDGRDIGSVVFPDADYKFYIDASSFVRAKRRYHQNKKLGIDLSFEEIKDSIERRDQLDKSRSNGPLILVDDAIFIDTSDMSLNQVIKKIKQHIGG